MKYYPYCLLPLILSACGSNFSENVSSIDTGYAPAFVTGVETVAAEINKRRQEFTLSGKVEYDPDRVISYVPLVSGVAEQTFFALGDRVSKGQKMIALRSSELYSLDAELNGLEQEAKAARRFFESSRGLYASDMISEAELLEAETTLKQIEAAMDYIRGELSRYCPDSSGRGFFISAPISGYVVEKNISSGSTITSESEPLFVIADLTSVWITINVYAGDLQFIDEGMEVRISTLSYPGEIYTGTISAMSHVFDPEEKVLKARVLMPNPDLKFKPEMSVMVSAVHEGDTDMVVVPTDAILFDDDRYHVVVQTGDGEYDARTVIPDSHENSITYLSSGLDGGEQVVTKNQLLIYTGIKEQLPCTSS
ncbi:MAG: efflux RND transporter periplasmic adaptor subunit [Rikenellaceae bacterium]|nr:efflux RND transporter periplasmic adaptor subunit [Rikenellaceae bacterium]